MDTREHPILITEPPLNAPRNRECVAELMFETFQVPALHIGLQPLLALYGTQACNTMDVTVRSAGSVGQLLARSSLCQPGCASTRYVHMRML